MIDDSAPALEIQALLVELTELLGLDDKDIQTALALIDYNNTLN